MDVTRCVASGSRDWVDPSLRGFTFNAGNMAVVGHLLSRQVDGAWVCDEACRERRSAPATIAAGGVHTCVVVSAGTVKCWGYNGSGQLGNGTTNDASLPVAVSDL
jgi:hypothetical protein